MQNTNYKSSIPSPFQARQRLDPVQQAVQANVEKFTLEISVEEDKETALLLKHLPGPVIAYKCTVSKGSQVLGIGRGNAILSKINKWVDRSVRYTFNASLIDSIIQSVKALDVLYLKDNTDSPAQETNEIDYATDKQKSYLRELINTNIRDESKRKYWEGQINMLTKDEASEKIQSFVGNNY